MESKICTKCRKNYLLKYYKLKHSYELTKCCIKCLAKNTQWYSNNKRSYYEYTRKQNIKHHQDCINDIIEKQKIKYIEFF